MSNLSPEQHAQRARALLDHAEIIHDAAAVQAAVDAIAQQLNARFAQPGSPPFPLVLGVMGGAVVFTGQLLTRLRFALEFDYIHVSRYGSRDQGGQIEWTVEPRADMRDRSVIVVDDILDEGATLAHVKQRLQAQGAREVLLAVLADKDIGRTKPVAADYVGLTLPNKFVMGFGMDAYGYWRNLPDIRAIDPGAG